MDVEKSPCGGCKNTIRQGLNRIAGVSPVQIDCVQQRVTRPADKAERQAIFEKRRSRGYPEQGPLSGGQTVCALGKVRESQGKSKTKAGLHRALMHWAALQCIKNVGHAEVLAGLLCPAQSPARSLERIQV